MAARTQEMAGPRLDARSSRTVDPDLGDRDWPRGWVRSTGARAALEGYLQRVMIFSGDFPPDLRGRSPHGFVTTTSRYSLGTTSASVPRFIRSNSVITSVCSAACLLGSSAANARFIG